MKKYLKQLVKELKWRLKVLRHQHFLVAIEKIPCMPKSDVHQRKNGGLYVRTNEKFQVKVTLTEDGRLQGDGLAEAVDPKELVEVKYVHR